MIIRQLFDSNSFTYTYLLGDEKSGKAVFIDPVLEKMDLYTQLLNELSLTLAVALDTHVHADHITALGALRKTTGCETFIGNSGDVECADNGLKDGQVISVGAIDVRVVYTPGHTDDSYTFLVDTDDQRYAFTGDTLLIRGSGRTDFQHGSSDQLYDTLHQKLMKLPEDTIVYPGHDYKGFTISTIGEEKKSNPRINLATREAFVDHMDNLNLPNPKMMDVAVPANRSCGNL
ncbi:MAG: MBL fold metallo-hydrolase [Agarilytica sp.]